MPDNILKKMIDVEKKTHKRMMETAEQILEMHKVCPILSSGYPGDQNGQFGVPDNKVYSSILGKFIDATTGKIIEENK